MKLQVREYSFAPVGAVKQALKEMNESKAISENTKKILNGVCEEFLDFLKIEEGLKGHFLISKQWDFYNIRIVREVEEK